MRERWERRGHGRPLLIGHRGASALEPENSADAFRRARADGADGVELDVLLCRSGEAVVFHDHDLRRLAGQPQRIADLGLAELRRVRLASGAAIPTLEEAIESCGPDLLVNVELKASRSLDPTIGPLVDAVARAIARAKAEERVLVSSFHPVAVGCWMRRSGGPAGLLFEAAASLPVRRAWVLPWLRPFAAHPESVLCSAGSVARWQRAGLAVNAWTVDAAHELHRLRDLGVDGIITNDPGKARRVLEV